MNKNIITPKVLKGFRDILPSQASLRRDLISKVESVFIEFGYSPIETPALEYEEILMGKGSSETDKQMFRFEDGGGRKVALRFDLTIPLARFVSTYKRELSFPFRRYHIAPVWRAEKPQRGRYREFTQCDFDIVGSTSIHADSEIVCIIARSMEALGVSTTIEINNRKLINGFLLSLGDFTSSTDVLRAIDKIDKVGEAAVANELSEKAKLSSDAIDKIFSFISVDDSGKSYMETLESIKSLELNNETATQGITELEALYEEVANYSLERHICINPSIARGLDYYTGTVFETLINDDRKIGSVCSGGRYDNLTGIYSKDVLPGVGASIGLDRLLTAMEDQNKLGNSSSAQVLIVTMSNNERPYALKVSRELREKGVSVELNVESEKIGNQLKKANKKHIPFALIIGESEAKSGVCTLKKLETGEQMSLGIAEVVEQVQD